MRRATRIGLLLAFLTALMIVGASGGALGECQSIGDATIQCGCPGGYYCG